MRAHIHRCRRRSAFIAVLAPVLILSVLSGPSAGQVLYGSVVGNVKDPTAASLPGATVTITHQATNLTRETQTDATGAYTFTNVLPGPYTVKVSLSGFREFVSTGVPVSVGNISRVDVTLQIGQLAETVTVQSESILLQTDKADVHTEIKSTEIVNMPLSNYRNFQTLINLAPGATPGRFQNAVIDTPARALTTNVNGTARNNNNVRQDGTANVYVWLPHHALYIASAETIDTVNVTTNAFDAEQGMAGGAAVTVITKSGTNEFRGSAFALHDNSKFQGRNFFLPADRDVPEGSRNIDGGTFGGPFKRDRLFFFGSYEGTFERINRFVNATVPTEAFRRGDFSSIPTVIYNPFTGNPDGTGREPFPNNQIPQSLLDPISQRMLGFIPAPNQDGLTQNFFNSSEQKFDRHQFDVKVNWNRSSAHQIWAKYGHMDALVHCDSVFGQGGGDGLCDVGAGDGDTLVRIATVGHTWTFGNSLIMDGTVGLNDFDQSVTTDDFGQNFGLEVLRIPGTNGPDPRQGGMPSFRVTGFSNMGNAFNWVPIFRNDRSYTANTNVTWLKSRHEMRFGVDVVRHELNHWQPELGAGGPRGDFVFGGGVTALRGGRAPDTFNSLAAFLLGLPTTMRKALQFELMTGREWQYAIYFRDRWDVNDKLTLNLGLRFEQYPLMQRAEGRGLERVDRRALESGQGINVLLGGVGGNPKDVGIEVKYPWVAPRVGAVYRLDEASLIRAGYGLTIDPMPFARPLRGFYPLTIAQDFASVDEFTWFAPLSAGIPPLETPPPGAGSVPLPNTAAMRDPDTDLQRGWIHSWNAIYERKLPYDFVVSAGYVGTATRKQLADLDVNAAGPGQGRAGQPLFVQYGRTAGLLAWDGRTRANYHSLQVSVNRPFLKGLLVKGAYTLSQAKNETDDSGWAGLMFNHPSVVDRNYALAGFDRTHVFQLGFVAELPFRAQDSPALDAVIKGWQVNGIVSAYSGNPFNVVASGASLNAPGNSQTADLVSTPERTGSVEQRTPYYNPSAWAPVTEVRFGTSGRNSVRGPGHKNVDFSVFRNFQITGRGRIEARMEVFNLFNTPIFNNPVNNVAAANFMHITSSQQPFDRQVRFGLRFSF